MRISRWQRRMIALLLEIESDAVDQPRKPVPTNTRNRAEDVLGAKMVRTSWKNTTQQWGDWGSNPGLTDYESAALTN